MTSRPDSAGIFDPVTWFGLISVSAMLICYALERRNTWFIFGFAISCALASIYGFLSGAWPFGVVEAIWSVVALQRWRRTVKSIAASRAGT